MPPVSFILKLYRILQKIDNHQKLTELETAKLAEMWEIKMMGELYSEPPWSQLSPDLKNPHARIGINRIVTQCAIAYEKLTKDDNTPKQPSRDDKDFENPLRMR